MSTKRKRAVLSIKDKQIIISRLDKGEKETNLAQEYSISKQQISDIRKDKDKNLKSTDSIDTSEGLKWIINIHIFDYLDSRLSGLFIEVPTSPDNRDSTVHSLLISVNIDKMYSHTHIICRSCLLLHILTTCTSAADVTCQSGNHSLMIYYKEWGTLEYTDSL